jgi:hypothetical protein
MVEPDEITDYMFERCHRFVVDTALKLGRRPRFGRW